MLNTFYMTYLKIWIEPPRAIDYLWMGLY
uniref:Uncharacterized protein n=1 Tax=Arundo donax TaxID=35708 RepID=A0A0A9FXM9_ARUDO